jgi:hypothetical protein
MVRQFLRQKAAQDGLCLPTETWKGRGKKREEMSDCYPAQLEKKHCEHTGVANSTHLTNGMLSSAAEAIIDELYPA